MALDDPGSVVGVHEGVEGQVQLLDGGESADPKQVFIQYPDEAFDAAVALGLAHEGRRAFDAEEGELPLVVVGDELAAGSWRRVRPEAIPSAKAPKAARTP